jgi:hypothetical protein
MDASHMVPIDVLTQIARRYLRIPTLEQRGSDRLDFHDVGVAGLQDALEQAYLAGLQAGLEEALASEQEAAFHEKVGTARR